MDDAAQHASIHTCLDRKIVDTHGQPAGEITDLLVDCRTGHIDFVRVAVTPTAAAGMSAAGQRRFVTIPWSALQVSGGDNDRWAVRASRDTLDQMARYVVDLP